MAFPHVFLGTLREHYLLLFGAAGSFALVTGFVGAWVGARFGARAALRRAMASDARDFASQGEVRALGEGLDALLLEVERIAEGQRFVAKLLAERAELRPGALPARRESGHVTPH